MGEQKPYTVGWGIHEVSGTDDPIMHSAFGETAKERIERKQLFYSVRMAEMRAVAAGYKFSRLSDRPVPLWRRIKVRLEAAWWGMTTGLRNGWDGFE